MSLQPVKDYKFLARDSESGAIINLDQNAYEEFLKRHRRAEYQKEVIEKNTNDINSIKSELTEIKTMLKTLLTEGKDHG